MNNKLAIVLTCMLVGVLMLITGGLMAAFKTNPETVLIGLGVLFFVSGFVALVATAPN